MCGCTDLLPSVDDVFGVRQSVDTWPPDDRVVTRGSVGHFHGTELKERLSQCHPAEQHLPAITNKLCDHYDVFSHF